MITRRSAAKNIIFTLGSFNFFPSFNLSSSFLNLEFSLTGLSKKHIKFIKGVSEIILPYQQSAIYKNIITTEFIIKMVDDCYKPEDIKKFYEGLISLEKSIKTEFKNNFLKLTKNQKISIIQKLDQNSKNEESTIYFYSIVKKHSIQAYLTSEFYLKTIMHYQISPGIFNGCIKTH